MYVSRSLLRLLGFYNAVGTYLIAHHTTKYVYTIRSKTIYRSVLVQWNSVARRGQDEPFRAFSTSWVSCLVSCVSHSFMASKGLASISVANCVSVRPNQYSCCFRLFSSKNHHVNITTTTTPLLLLYYCIIELELYSFFYYHVQILITTLCRVLYVPLMLPHLPWVPYYDAPMPSSTAPPF